MHFKNYLLFFCLTLNVGACASTEYPTPSEEAKKAANLISDAEQNLNGDPIKNYQSAIGLLSRQGQMLPSEMLLMARAFVALGNATRATKASESQDYFTRATVVLNQISQQIKLNPQAKDNPGILQESIGLGQQAKDALPPVR